jgi:anhydro-N-acetylmuramic acid kinase
MDIQKAFLSNEPLSIRAIGIMSGTSLDGLDICLAEFQHVDEKWSFAIRKAKTINYPENLKQQLGNSMLISGQELALLDAYLGKWIGNRVNEFLVDLNITADVIGSHGHTVFHDPQKGYSTQIGSGAHIAAITGIPCVCNFRVGDVARGGQGAPLVPIGDEMLFSDYHFCLNLGGFSNISFKKSNQRVAFDICPVNIILNHLSIGLGMEYDEQGQMGRLGNIDQKLLDKLNSLPYYQQNGAKSLGKEWLIREFLPLMNTNGISIENKFRTVYEHISLQVSQSLSNNENEKVLVTGGGAKNDFLMELIRSKTKNQIIIPLPELVDFKEALVFGFLAVLYQLKIPSCIASATGARESSVGGCVFY